MNNPAASTALLGDSAERDYSLKLSRFNAFAEPELRRLIDSLELQPGMRVLDAGCGTGEALQWLWQKVDPGGQVIGIDLSAAHAAVAAHNAPPRTTVLQANLLELSLEPASFDLIWCVNTINHLRDPLEGVEKLARLLRPGGRIALGQSSLVPDMFFAWDSRLEAVTNDAVRRYYRERYRISERDLTGVRAIVGLLHKARLREVAASTAMIERTFPTSEPTDRYLVDAIFRATWGERLQPYLAAADYAELRDLCNPDSPGFALRRPDFHFLQSLTLTTGRV